MNQPRVYMCSPSGTPLPPPSPSHPLGSSQCTSPEHPVSCIEPGLVIYFRILLIELFWPGWCIRLFFFLFPFWTSLVAQMVKRLPTMRETQVQSLGREDPLEKEIAAHSSTLAWKIPWTEEHGRLQSMGSQRVRHDWATSLSLSLFLFWTVLWETQWTWVWENCRK